MTKQYSGNRSFCGLSRRSVLQSTAAFLSVPFVVEATSAWAQEKLAGAGEVVVLSWGGSYTDGIRRYVYEPFTKATGIRVVDVVTDLAEPQIKAMHQAGRVDWDIAYVSPANYPAMHESEMFVPIDYGLWDQESLEGASASTRLKDAVVAEQSGMVLAYDTRAFPNGGPRNWGDFWDVKKYPGPRGLFGSNGKVNIEFALIAAGVAHSDVFPLTDDKVDRAFEKLNEIKPHIAKWWVAGGEAPQLLINREYAMTSIYDGRAVAAVQQGTPIKFTWEGANMGVMYGVILKGGPNTANAQKLIAFWNRAQIAAGRTQGTGYPGPNINQVKYLPHDLASLVSINPENASKVVFSDDSWLVAKRPDGKTNADHIQERWIAWRAA
ncbi:ABC transporter substrate-binding protein [Bradyrhizobium sp. 186]|uniref:ABC transporter substrate-binding protein n=1 Tax=Bradyrhizobium sp. 186 TaxID=2782654 RepID=UPI002000C529|nr:ABC transporter substrate-binding protein [Bradyrhizobium sp. 186]UPK34495.1 ABC transporter substrate-binding protein [Bradyrhizobium sp. 186]